MVNKELDILACEYYVCSNIGLIEEKCREHGISENKIEEIKYMVMKYFRQTYRYPRYRGSPVNLFPAFIYLVMNMKEMKGIKYVDTSLEKKGGNFTQYICSRIFGVSSATIRKWIIDIVQELKINFRSKNKNYYFGNDAWR